MSSLSLKRWALPAFILSLAWATLPIGSNRPWALALTLPPLLLLAAVAAWRRPISPWLSLPGWLARGPGLLVAGFLLLLIVQCLTLFQGQALSVVPARTLAFLQMALGCAVSAWLVVRLVSRSGDLRLLLFGLVGVGLLQAGLAAVLMATHATVPLFDSEIEGTGVATGTFANRNHFAACLNIALSAGIGLLMGGLSSSDEPVSWRQQLRGWLELLLSGKARLRLLLVVLVVMLIATRSRMGNSAFFVALLVSASIYAVLSRRRQRNVWIFVASMVLVDVALIGAWVGVDKVVERVQGTNLLRDAPAPVTNSKLPDLPVDGTPPVSEASSPDSAGPAEKSGSAAAAAPAVPRASPQQSVEDRTDPSIDALALVRDYPWLGTGAGTFFVAYMGYAQKDQGFYNHAHNDYLEAAADTGLIGLGLLLALGAASFIAALRILRTRHNADIRAAAFASIMAIACLALHSTVDFSLQIPANAWLFSTLLALPFAASRLRRGGKGDSEEEGRVSSRSATVDSRTLPSAALHLVLATVSTVALLASGWTVLRLGAADYASLAANARMTLWERGEIPMTLGGLQTVEETLKTAIAVAPEVPDYYETLGNVYFARALLAEGDEGAGQAPPDAGQRQRDLRAAADQYRLALERNRVSPYTWNSLLAAKSRLNEIDDEFRVALNSAARYGPYEPNVQATILSAGLAAWPLLAVGDRRLVAQTVTRGWPTNRDRLAAEARADDFPAHWCDLSPQGRPLVDSPPDVAKVMMGLCRVAATVEPAAQ
jgi:3-polyprenyl-4-hydroxybenzoate decarboxylase